MASRYRLTEGIVIRRSELPSGDLVVTLLCMDGKLRGVARKGKLVGGNLGKLSLFNDVTVQFYRRREEDLAVLTQVRLNGLLARLPHPEIYPYAHLLAELADALTVDADLGESAYTYLASGLRGLARHHDPSHVALVYCWKLLFQAGLAPRLTRCARCGAAGEHLAFDVASGGTVCLTCGGGITLAPKVRKALVAMVHLTVRGALDRQIVHLEQHWLLLHRYVAYHVGELRSFGQIAECAGSAALAT